MALFLNVLGLHGEQKSDGIGMARLGLDYDGYLAYRPAFDIEL